MIFLPNAKPFAEKTRLLMTYACNAVCDYCHNEGQEKPIKTRMSAEFVDKLLGMMGTNKVVLSGGEPTLNRNVEDIARTVKEHGVYLAMNTHGANTERLRTVFPYVDEIRVSFDSLDKSTYEGIKGMSYETVMANIQEAREYGVKVKLNIPLTDMRSVEDLVDFSIDTGIELKIIEILGEQFENARVPIGKVEANLRKRGFALSNGGLRKRAALDDSKVVLTKCYCRDAVITEDAKKATQVCRSYTDLYITPDGQLKPCIYGSGGIPIYDAVMSEDQHRFQERFSQWKEKFGIGACHDVIRGKQNVRSRN